MLLSPVVRLLPTIAPIPITFLPWIWVKVDWPIPIVLVPSAVDPSSFVPGVAFWNTPYPIPIALLPL